MIGLDRRRDVPRLLAATLPCERRAVGWSRPHRRDPRRRDARGHPHARRFEQAQERLGPGRFRLRRPGARASTTAETTLPDKIKGLSLIASRPWTAAAHPRFWAGMPPRGGVTSSSTRYAPRRRAAITRPMPGRYTRAPTAHHRDARRRNRDGGIGEVRPVRGKAAPAAPNHSAHHHGDGVARRAQGDRGPAVARDRRARTHLHHFGGQVAQRNASTFQ